MQIVLTVVAGPHVGKIFVFDRHDHFFVGRAKFAHFRLPEKDPYFSRMHFMIEVNPPVCRLLDLGSTNGTLINGQTRQSADLQHGDQIQGGDTVLKVTIRNGESDEHPPTVLKQSVASEAAAAATLSTELYIVPDIHDIASGDKVSNCEWSVPGFVFEQKLGSGGMGDVYRARRLADDKPVAIKILKPAMAGSAMEYQRFLREIDILRNLDHPAIVQLIEAGEADGNLYFTMELVNGCNAKEFVEKQPKLLPVSTAVGVIVRVLNALSFAHSRGFVHRDVKPTNILIEQERKKLRVKLADFGLARAYQESKFSGLTLTGDICGTPKFMAPEQITDSRNVQPASDQYSAAATLYWLLTRQHTHNFAGRVNQALSQILLEDPVPIRERRTDIPESLARTIQRALSKDASSRFPSVAHMSKRLKLDVNK